MVANKRFGIALSGGGYRAAGFHIGTLRKLAELGLLEKVDVMSTISGGSITGAAYCLHQGSYNEFEEKMISALSTKNVIGYIYKSSRFLVILFTLISGVLLTICLLFTKVAPLAILPMPILIFLLLKYQFVLFPVSDIIEKAYKKFFYGEATLEELCITPELAIGSTNLQTGRQFTFSKRKMEDSFYAYLSDPVRFDGAKFPVSRAVVASSCVPFAFTPVEIGQEFFIDKEQFYKISPKLIDGGVYDNQGIHKLSQENSSYSCQIILVSDAGSNLNLDGFYNNTITLLLRTSNLFMGRIKNFQMMQNLYRPQSIREIAYQSLGWELENCIDGFIDNMKQGNISQIVLDRHNILQEWQNSPGNFSNQIASKLRENCKEADILSRKISTPRIDAIREVGTNLTPINRSLLEDLITFAADLTELQLRLYCPSLFKKN